MTSAVAPLLAACFLSCHALAQSFDAGGPIMNAGMNAVAAPGSVQAPGYRFENRCAKPAPWQAQWIWVGQDAPDRGWFRKEITLDDDPKQVSAWLTADVKYRLWINGRLVSRGPVDIGADYAGGSTHRWFYDFRDLTKYFSKGRNVIAAEVFRKWPIGHTVSRGGPGLLFEALVDGRTVKSDATWRAVPSDDGYGWQSPDFDDKEWPQAKVVEDRWQPLVPSEIPPLMEVAYPVLRVEGLPANRTITRDASFKVVFDRVLSGFPTIKVKGGKGATVKIKSHGEVGFKLGGGVRRLEFHFMDEIVPSYTVTFSNVTEPVEILDAGAYFTSQPVEYRGSFDCSDAKLNEIWKVSRWAVQICLQTHHLDSPNHQEPISDPGDYLIEAMVNNNAFAQPWLTRQDVRKFAWLLKDEKYHNFHTSYSIGWLQMLMDYYDHTGDRSLVVEMAPYVHELLDTYASWRGRNGILSEAPNYMFMDWVNISGFGCHHPPAVIGQGYLTAFYYHGMELASRVASLTGDNGRVAEYARLRSEIATAFNRELWDADKGLYRDGRPFQTSVKPGQWLPADKDIETFSPHVNLLAVLYDLAPAERHQAMVRKVMSEVPLNTQPWFMHWVFQAIDHAGLFDEYGAQQMRRWKVVAETQSFREMWNGGDLSHGWCSTPLVQMSTRVLGVTPSSPGFDTIAIRPALCDLTYANGRVPTPHGDVDVAWKLAEDKLLLDVAIPAGTMADLAVPVGRFEGASASMDGAKCEPMVRLAPGRHHIEVTGRLKPLAPAAASGAVDALDADVIKDDLAHRLLESSSDHCTHNGGGSNTSALFNGTTLNGEGGSETRDDGATFRGYGKGDWLEMRLKKPCDLSELRTFTNHEDARADQSYSVLVARASQPDRFEKVASGNRKCAGGPSELRVQLNEKSVVAVRLEFQKSPMGFSVYREIGLIGRPSGEK